MGYFKNTFEGGTNGANLTVAGSGGASGDAFDTIVVNNAAKNGGGPAVQYLTAAAIQGALGLRITTQAATSYVRWSDPTPGARGVARLPFYFNGNPSAQLDLATIRSEGGGPLGDSAGAAMISLVCASTGRIAIAPAGSTDAASQFLLPSVGLYWIEFAGTKGTTTTDGKGELRVYAADGTTLLHNYTNSACNCRSSNAWQYRWGGVTTATGYTYVDLDSIQAGALTGTSFHGPLANTPPTISSISAAQNVAAAASVSCSVTASDPDGTIASYAWTVDYCSTTSPTLSGASTATCTFTAPAAGNLVVLKCTVTDNGGATTSSTSEVRVPSSSTPLTILPDDAGKGHTTLTPWGTFGGAATAAAALRDGSGTTGIESADVGAVAQTTRHRLAPSTSRANAKITLEGLAKTDSSALTAEARLYQGGTLRQTWGLSPTTTPTDVDLDLSSGAVSAITDWADLWLYISAED